MAKKHLLLVHYSADSRGGFVSKSLAQINFLKKEFEITTILPAEGEFTDKVREAGVEVFIRPLTDTDKPLRYFISFLTFCIFLLRKKIDVIYFLDFIWWKPAEALAAHFLRIPTLAYCGNHKEPTDLNGHLKLIDAVYLASESARQVFLDHGDYSNSHVIYNFLSEEFFSKEIKAVEAKTAEFRFGFVGTVKEAKGICYAIEAIGLLVARGYDVELLIVGPIEEQFLGTLQEKSKALGVERHVIFRGASSTIKSEMSALDVLLVPSLQEAFGFVNIEAAALKIPVVASNVGGIPEVVLDGETGLLVEPGSGESIADACQKLIADSDLRNRLGENAFVRVRDNFTENSQLPKWKEAIYSVMNS